MKKRVLSGMRPTGKLHLGNLHGALANWKKLQEQYECYFFVADWHALTSDYQNPAHIQEYVKEMLIDWLAAGLDPQKATIFIQSKVPEHTELHLLFSMITPLAWLERNPTYKEQKRQLIEKDLNTYGFLGYPVLQAADILIYKAHYVPVGIDQLPHIELTREIARRFNYLYKEVFPLPEPLLAKVPKLLGLDGRKMSKSYHNAIYLSDPPDEVRKKVSQMFTDKSRLRKTDPGHPDICNVFSFHKIYTNPDTMAQIEADCKAAKIGCVECKKILAENLIAGLGPHWEKRAYYQGHENELQEIVNEGIRKATQIAKATLEEAKRAVGI